MILTYERLSVLLVQLLLLEPEPGLRLCAPSPRHRPPLLLARQRPPYRWYQHRFLLTDLLDVALLDGAHSHRALPFQIGRLTAQREGHERSSHDVVIAPAR